MRVSIFGGAQPTPGTPAYEEAYILGRLLGQAGHTVLTGGYIGTMEAISRGCSETGGHVIGVTCDDIEKWRNVGPNVYIKEEMRFLTLGERLNALIFNCDAAIALAGGIGTLTEIALYWNYLAIGTLPVRPLVLVGDDWQVVFETLLERLNIYIPRKSQAVMHFAPNVQVAFDLVNNQQPQTA